MDERLLIPRGELTRGVHRPHYPDRRLSMLFGIVFA